MNCPICNNNTVELKTEKTEREFRKEKFKVFESYYFCNSCKNDFTTSEQDGVSVNQVYNQYREKYKIPSPEQIKFFKEEYGLNSTSFSKLLGFGVNQLSNYEKGELPNESNGNLLSLCIDPKEVLNILERRNEVFTETQYNKIYKKLTKLVEFREKNWLDLKNIFFNKNVFPTKYNGYSVPSFEKFSHMVLFFLENAPYKTRLNKLLFYSDFTNYKFFGSSISGMEYAAIPWGPVPEKYEIKFGLLSDENIISTELETINSSDVDKFVPQKEFDKTLFSKNELNILEKVLGSFGNRRTKDIIDISHEEKGWKDNILNKGLISYLDYAPLLKEI